MRSGLHTILQTLTPESSSVLTQSISDAGRRNHTQTTPLHVAAALLSSPSSAFLRHACINSQPNSNPPRALELCFSVALDRLPSNSTRSKPEPPISNALMATLKRAQAHQRRGCPEQQQQPLLAVKVELEQLVVSILDDPGVSRVMREAGFSSPAVKASIEQQSQSQSQTVLHNNRYINPKLRGDLYRKDEVNRVLDVLFASKSTLSDLIPRLGGRGNGILSNSITAESLPSTKDLSAMRQLTKPNIGGGACVDVSPWLGTLCALCKDSYELELAKVVKELDLLSNLKPESLPLPSWLQSAKLSNPNLDQDRKVQSEEHELNLKQRTEDLLKKWRGTCSRLHSNFNPAAISRPLLFQNANILPTSRPPLHSPVKTELVLGHSEAHSDRVKVSVSCSQEKFSDKILVKSDIDSFKRLFNGLTERVRWQPEAASRVANIIMQSRTGNRKRRNFLPKPDTWLLFTGPDQIGKRRMASALSELVFSTSPIAVQLGATKQSDSRFRGRTALDLLVEAVRMSPFSVIAIEGINQADKLTWGRIRQAMDVGRMTDSSGREVSLGSIIFVLITDCLPKEFNNSLQLSLLQSEERILGLSNCVWELELSIDNYETTTRKHKADQQYNEHNARPSKVQKESLPFDLNLVADDSSESSRNSSVITLEQEPRRLAMEHLVETIGLESELVQSVDEAIVFKPVDFGPLRKMVSDSISEKFRVIVGNEQSIKVDDDALDRMIAGLWISDGDAGLKEWTERVLGPSMHQLRNSLRTGSGSLTVRLSAVKAREEAGAVAASICCRQRWLLPLRGCRGG